MPTKKTKNKSKRKTTKRVENNNTQQNKVNKTRTIEVNVVSNVQTNNKKANKKNKKIKEKKVKPQKEKVKKVKNKNTGKILKRIVIVALVLGSIAFLCTTPLFNVTKIEVLGNEIVSKEEITSLSQIKLNENMFKMFKKNIKQNIKGNAYIENVDVKRVLPNKMQITVQERSVKFMVRLLDTFAYINSQGYILEITNQTKEVPIIEGISTPAEEIAVGKRLNTEDLNGIEVALSIVSSCEENEISRYITFINIENSNEYIMYMAEKAKTVHLGNSSNLGTKMLYVKAILEAEDGNEGDIFVNGDLNNGFQPFYRKKV